jgi:hypothetical protein
MLKYILRKKIKKNLKKKSSKKCFLNLNAVHSILIFFDANTYEEVDFFAEKLKKIGKKITAYAYKSKHDKKDYTHSPYRIIKAEEVESLFNSKIDILATELAKQTFDAVIDLTLHENLFIEYLLAHSDAFIKTGLKKNNTFLYDLSIVNLPEMEKENLKVRELAKQIIYYLHTIRSGH